MKPSTDIEIVPLLAGALFDTGSVRNVTELDIGAVKDVYHKYGSVILSGLDMNGSKFVDITNQFGTKFVPYVGGADNNREIALKEEPTVLTVTGGSLIHKAIPLHGEMYYTAIRPAVLYFCCIKPARNGGETTLCDGVAVWQELPDQIRSQFLSKQLEYTRRFSRDEWKRVFKTEDLDEVLGICENRGTSTKTHSDDSLETMFRTPAYVDHASGRAFVNSLIVWSAREIRGGKSNSLVRFEGGEEIPRKMLRNIYRVEKALTTDIPWLAGDVCIVDNERMMHGRNAYPDPDRHIIMRLGESRII